MEYSLWLQVDVGSNPVSTTAWILVSYFISACCFLLYKREVTKTTSIFWAFMKITWVKVCHLGTMAPSQMQLPLGCLSPDVRRHTCSWLFTSQCPSLVPRPSPGLDFLIRKGGEKEPQKIGKTMSFSTKYFVFVTNPFYPLNDTCALKPFHWEKISYFSAYFFSISSPRTSP